MEIALLAGLAGLIGLVIYWVWRSAINSSNAEAFKESAAEAEERARALNVAMVEDARKGASEDRRNASEIVRTRDADGARELLLNATGRKPK